MGYGIKNVPVAQPDRASAFYPGCSGGESRKPGHGADLGAPRRDDACARPPASLLIARYLQLRERHRAGHYNGHPDTPEIKSALCGAMADVWRGLGEADRLELAVALARKGAEPVSEAEAIVMAALVEGDALPMRREAHRVAAAFLAMKARAE